MSQVKSGCRADFPNRSKFRESDIVLGIGKNPPTVDTSVGLADAQVDAPHKFNQTQINVRPVISVL
jgi:hypothetical protein